MRVRYIDRKFNASSLEVIEQANAICERYDGVSLTLRQLYYQFVQRNYLPNRQQSYDRLGSIINDARLAGKFDWDYIIDRTRGVEQLRTWTSPKALIDETAKVYRTDLWAPQKRRIEVWIEKDAAIGVIESVCNANGIPFFSCRGYTSQTAMWDGANRIGEYLRNGEQTTILHIGDHDPSGLDMTRDIIDRLTMFVHNDWANEFMGFGSHTRGSIRASMREEMGVKGSEIDDHELPWEVRRIALTIEQIDQYQPPPNYAKQSDSRYEKYVHETGLTDSWELDALDPLVMEQLIQDEIDRVRDYDIFSKAERAQEIDRAVLKAVGENWDTIKSVHAPKEEGAKS